MAARTAWDDVADMYCQRNGEEGGALYLEYIRPPMFRMLGDIKGKRILDIGCGPGYLTRHLAKCGAKVTGADLSAELLKKAREREGKAPLGIKYVQLDAAKLEGVPDSSFDIVTSNLALHAVKDIESAIRECSRVMRPGGKLVFSIMHPVTDMTELSDYQRDLWGMFIRLRKYGNLHNKRHRGYKLQNVPIYHRPIGFYMNELFKGGFVVSGCDEIAIRHVNRAVGLPGFFLPAIRAGSAFAPAVFSKYMRLEKTDDGKAIAELAEFPKFLLLEATKKG